MLSAMGDAKALRVGTLTPIASLDPHRAHDFTGHLVLAQVYEPLFVRQRDRVEPRLASAMPQRLPGSNAVVIELRDDVRFSDGSAMTPADVVSSLSPMLVPYGIEASFSGTRLLLKSMSWTHRAEDVLSGIGMRVAKPTPRGPIGTGPYAIAATADDGVQLEANPHARTRAAIPRVVVRYFAAGADGRPVELLAALEAGEIDFTLALARDDVAALKNVRKLFQAGMSTAFLAFNTERGRLADVELRRALALAIDRYRLTELCYANPAAFVARCLLPPALGRGNDGLRHDPAAAAAAIRERGAPPPLRMVRVWGPRPYLPRPDAVAASLVQQLRDVGVRVDTIVSSDSEDYNERLDRGDYDLVLGGWIADTADPIDYLSSTVGSGGILGTGASPGVASNFARWRDAATDDALLTARGGASSAVDEVLARVASEVPLVPLMHGARVIVHGWHVKGYDPEAGPLPDFAALDLDGG